MNDIERKTKSRAYKAAVGAILTSTLSVGCYATIPVYLLPLSQAYEVGIGQTSLLFTFASVGSLIVSLLFGSLLKALKVRPLTCISSVCLIAFFVLMSLGQSITLVYVGAVLFGIATVCGGFAMSQTVITLWFDKNRAKIISFISMGVGAAGMVLSPIVATMITNYGVLKTARIQGVVVGVLMIANALFLLSEHPSAYGMKPYGYTEASGAAQATAAGASGGNQGMGVSAILRTAPFWLIVLATIMISGAQTGFSNNASAFYQTTVGLTAVQASFCVSLYSGVKLIWSPAYGTLVDKKGPAFATLICGGIGVVIFAVSNFLTGYSAAIAIAICTCALCFNGMLGAICFPRIYGTKEAANLVGFANAAGSVGAMVGAPVAGFIYDSTGSYSTYMLFAAAVVAVGVIFVMIATGKKAAAK